MVQAARRGKQNHTYGVTEGCMASGTCSGCLYGHRDIYSCLAGGVMETRPKAEQESSKRLKEEK